MRIAVIGAGVVGVTTAYELAVDGHDVVVYERSGTVASECSFANAGLVAPAYVSPWAAPGMPGKVLRNLFAKHAAVRVGAHLDATTLRWLWRWWRACRPDVYRANRARMHRLADFSRDRLEQLTQRLALDFERRRGFLVLLRTERELALARAGLRALAELGTAPKVVDADECRRIEPGLSMQTPLHAGLYSPDDQVGNCRQFTHLLKREAERVGCRFRFGTAVQRIASGKRPHLDIASVDDGRRHGPPSIASSGWESTLPNDDDGDTSFDAVVVCAGIGARPLLAPLGLKLPMIAVHGYSTTAPLRHDEAHLHFEPRAALMDERYKVAISRIGNRVRVAGSAEIGTAPGRHDDAAQATLDRVLDDWFPGIAQPGAAQRWKGGRPMLPDGPPILGPSGRKGVWLNVGHGGSGWAMSAGAARLVADAIAGRKTPIEIDGLGIERLAGQGLPTR